MTTCRKRTGVVLGICLLLAFAMLSGITAFADDSVFAGGSGTAEDPWQIADAEQLDHVRDDLTASYVLTADIDLGSYESWQPIGTFRSRSDAPEDAEIPHPDFAFSGSFDGGGHTISNLTVNEPQSMAVGLFGCASGTENGAAFIGNFTLENVQVSGFYLVGGAVGLQFMNCPVSDIKLIGDNQLTGMQGIGGIVGPALIPSATAPPLRISLHLEMTAPARASLPEAEPTMPLSAAVPRAERSPPRETQHGASADSAARPGRAR